MSIKAWTPGKLKCFVHGEEAEQRLQTRKAGKGRHSFDPALAVLFLF